MSFSSDCKKELCQIKPEKSCCLVSELCALYMSMGSLNLLGRGKVNVQFASENIAVCRRVYTLLTQAVHIAPQIHYVSNARFGGTRRCVLTLGPLNSPAFLCAMGMAQTKEDGAFILRSTTPKVGLTRSCCMRAFLRGALLGGGNITNPEQGYHLELPYRDDDMRENLAKCLQRFDLPIKQSARKGRKYLYLKQIDQIVTFLTVAGASQTVMEIENLRVQRQVMASVHRMINCDNANLEKQMKASDEQLEIIAELSKNDGLKGLPKSLQDIAQARLNAPDATLAQLGEAMNPPIGKSGVNHRMRRLMEYAEIQKKGTQ